MRPEVYQRVRSLFFDALQQPAAEQTNFVRRHATNPAEADQVIRLLAVDSAGLLQTFSALDAAKGLQPEGPQHFGRVGRYELLELLGEGGMGEVYQARAIDGPEHRVALKLMRGNLFTAATRARFEFEQQTLAKLSHPGIAHYIDTGQDQHGNAFVAMELVRGLSLRDYALRHQLDVRARVVLFRQLLSAVAYAHRQLIIHRDIKSENVLVTSDGVVKLLDFGIAKPLAGEARLTGTLERLFTPTSAAPEQIRGERCDVTTDVYALGVLLYEFIAGRPVFDSASVTPGQFEANVLNVPPPSMQSRYDPLYGCKSIPRDLERIVSKAIRKEQQQRYQSVEQLDADLANLLESRPVTVSGNAWLYRSRMFLSRNRLASLFAALALSVVVLAIAVTMFQNQSVRKVRDRAQLALDTMKQSVFGQDNLGNQQFTRNNLRQTADTLLPKVRPGNAEALTLATMLLEVQLSIGEIEAAGRTYHTIRATGAEASELLCLLGARLLVEQQQAKAAASRLQQCQPSSDSERRLQALIEARLAHLDRNHGLAAQRFAELQTQSPVGGPEWTYAIEQRVAALSESARNDEALSVLDAADEQALDANGADSTSYAALQVARLKALAAMGDQSPLKTEARLIIARLEAHMGADAEVTARAEAIAGQALLGTATNAQAMKYLSNALRTFRAKLGDNHRDTLELETFLAVRQPFPESRPLNGGRAIQAEALSAQRTFEDLLTRTDQPSTQDLHQDLLRHYAFWAVGRTKPDVVIWAMPRLDEAATTTWAVTDSSFRDMILGTAMLASRCIVPSTFPFDLYQTCGSLPPLEPLCFQAREQICHGHAQRLFGRPDPLMKINPLF